jgi:hypothetical protein
MSVSTRLEQARRDYHDILMSDPDAPGYYRLCSMAEERVDELEREEAEAAAPQTLPLLPLATYDPSEVWGDIPHQSPYRDFSALAPERPRPISQVFGGPNPRAWRVRQEAEVATAEARATETRAAADRVEQQLDTEWESANLGGPGCPFCDSIMGGCSCWQERAEMHRLRERQQVRASRAEIAARVARGECTCDQMTQHSDYPSLCEVCEQEERLRCTGCGQLQCRPDCCGDCGGCSRCCGPACRHCDQYGDRCWCHDDQEDDRSSCGCGACEEHDWRRQAAGVAGGW